MGEIIKKFSKLPNGLDIELNAPQKDGQDFVIHLQNEYGRISLTRSEFIQLALLFNCAEHNLKTYKELDLHDDE